jgi:glucose/arabinose dehydrogenase
MGVVLPGCRDARDARQLELPARAAPWQTLTVRLALSVLVVVAGCGKHDRAERSVAKAPAGSAQAKADPPPGSAALVAVPADVAAKVGLKEVVHGLDRPVALVAAPGDARRRLFIVEQHKGRIRVLENGQLADRPFFTIGGLSDGNEEGLLGLAFHPEFAKNGRFYVNYTSKDMATHIVEYTANGDAADPKTARELIRIAQPYSNHNGGNLVFGPDGKLYTGMGDGGAANDPKGNGQNGKALLGKILRFDVDHPVAEIVHLGMRNPWRFSFDQGNLYIGDVGQNLWEEVDVAPAGQGPLNFGWNIMEGTHCFDPDTGTTKDTCDRSGLTLPVTEYPHDEGCSITGGFVYRGKALPQLAGAYFYADYCTGLLRSFRWDKGAMRDHWDWKAAIDNQGVLSQVSSFGVDADGELYIVELTGAIYELVPKS